MKALNIFKKPYILIIFLILFALPAALPLLRGDFFSTHDETHMVDIYEMFRSLQVGGFPPRWVPDVNFDLGHPYFNFYYHLPFYITSFFMWLHFSMIFSYKTFMVLSIFSAILGFYFFARRHFSNWSAFIAAVLYLYTPYFAVDLYVRGALGELGVFALLPWVAFSLNSLVEKISLSRFVLTSFLITLLSLSHNVLHIFLFPLLLSYTLVLILINKRDIKQKIGIVFLVFIFGSGLSSYYLLPAIVERQYISSYEQIKIEDQFPFIKQLIIPHWGYGTSHWGPDDDFSMQIGIVNLTAVALGLGLLLKTRVKKGIGIFFITVFGLVAVLMNSRTLPFWNLHPVLRYFQFPWRLLLVTTFATSFLAAFVSDYFLSKVDQKRMIFYALLTAGIILMLNVWYFRPSGFKTISDERYLEAYFADRTLAGDGVRKNLSPEYLGFSEDFIPPTKWQKKRPNNLPKEWVESLKQSKIQYQKDNLAFPINIDTKIDNNLLIYQTYFPGWSAKVDDKPVDVYPATDFGIVSLNVPAGKHEVSVKFENTLIRNLANQFSEAFGMFLILISLSKLLWKINRKLA